VAIDSIADMRALFEGIPLDSVSTSMTINAPAALLLLLYELVAEEQGVPAEVLTGTIQNDVLKEYIARGNYIFPARPSMRLTAQQAENNIVRVAVQAFSAVCGSAQSLHTNAFDEALALPTEHSATIALRTQQILAAEAGAVDTADPLAGSYYVEALTDAFAD